MLVVVRQNAVAMEGSMALTTVDKKGASPTSISQYNVVWNEASRNSGESMPCGGGDIGANVWVENDELLLYVNRAGCRDENGELLKSGRFRVKVSPNPFATGTFRQELVLREGCVIIEARQTEGTCVTIKVWIEVIRPIVHIDIDSTRPATVEATYESWRTEKIELPCDESKHGRRGMCMLN